MKKKKLTFTDWREEHEKELEENEAVDTELLNQIFQNNRDDKGLVQIRKSRAYIKM